MHYEEDRERELTKLRFSRSYTGQAGFLPPLFLLRGAFWTLYLPSWHAKGGAEVSPQIWYHRHDTASARASK